MVLMKCSNLIFGYKEHIVDGCVAKPLDFELQAGEVVALMGENGCGKSTLLKTLAGAILPLQGSVFIAAGTDVPKKEKWQKKTDEELIYLQYLAVRERAKRIALVRMSGIEPDRMTVREFVSLGRSPYAGLFDGRTAEDERQIDQAISLLELEPFGNRLVDSLSDGERSRVYLAEAVAQQVQVLLLDEPNAFLDIPRSHKLFKLLKKLAVERDMGIVVSTHSVEYAERYCDRLMVIHDGSALVESAGLARQKGLLDWTE